MSRDLPAELSAAIDRPVVRPFLALHIAFPDPVWVWTGIGTLTFPDDNGVMRAWLGAGEVGAVDEITEATDGSAAGLKVGLFKIPGELRDDVMAQIEKNAPAELYVGALNETFQQVEAAKLLTRLRADDYRITDGDTTLTVEIALESRAIDQRRPSIRRFTHEHHQRTHPGDMFFEYVSQMSRIEVMWAAADQKPAGAGGGGSGGGGGGGLSRMFEQ